MEALKTIEIFIDQIISFMVSFGPIGGFLLTFLEAFFPPLPIGLIVGLNILSFGNIFGFIISYIGTLTGCIMTFSVVRNLFKDKFEHWSNSKNKESIKKWIDKLSNIKFESLVILLCLPITPSFIFNIAGGLSKISYRKYFIALLISKPMMLLIYGYIATTLKDALKNPIIFIKVLLLITITYIISKTVEKIVKVE